MGVSRDRDLWQGIKAEKKTRKKAIVLVVTKIYYFIFYRIPPEIQVHYQLKKIWRILERWKNWSQETKQRC